MRFLLLGLMGAVAAGAGNAQTVAIQPAPLNSSSSQIKPNAVTANRKPVIAVPILGYLLDSDGAGLVPIRGVASAPLLGDLVAKPAGVERIYLPPRQHYALVEQSTTGALAIWHLARRHMAADQDLLDLIPGVSANPDIVAFSPSGKSAALYSSSQTQIQVLTGLPARPVVQTAISAATAGQLTTIALSDDGQIVLATNSTGQIELSADGKLLHAVPWTYSLRAASFMSNTHNVLLSDARQRQLLLIQSVEAPNSAPAVLGNGLEPDHLAVASDGETILALDTARQMLWQIDARTLAAKLVPAGQQAQTLITLRDGHTFLLSNSPLSLLKLTDSASPPAVVTNAGLTVEASGKQ